LFFVFELSFETGNPGYVTFVDTAARESPTDIFDEFFDTSNTTLSSVMSHVGGHSTVAKNLRTDPGVYSPETVLDNLKECFFINETINHMIYYFNKKTHKKTKILFQSENATKYSLAQYYINPISEETTINKSNNCLTIPIMNFLNTLSNKNKLYLDYKPTKFIMICNVRQEEKYCDQTLETLRFAQTLITQ
jgi:hypothetical protein